MACDPNFGQVTLLLHCDGTSGSTVFTDLSNQANIVTAQNSAQVDTSQSMFGGASLSIDGSSALGYYNSVAPYASVVGLTTPIVAGSANDITTGGADFTIECWFYASPNLPNYFNFIPLDFGNDNWSGTTKTGFYVQLYFAGSYQYLNLVSTTAGWPQIAAYSAGGIALATWYHIAVVRVSGVVSLYLNGVSQGTPQTWAGACNPDLFTVGGTPSASGSFGTGWVDEVRISSFARYTTNFTPPADAFGVACLAPDILGLLPAAANALIVAGGFTVGTVTTENSADYATGLVCSQTTVGSVVNYVVSDGSLGGSAYGRFVGSNVFKAVEIVNIGDIRPKVWYPADRNTTRP